MTTWIRIGHGSCSGMGSSHKGVRSAHAQVDALVCGRTHRRCDSGARTRRVSIQELFITSVILPRFVLFVCTLRVSGSQYQFDEKQDLPCIQNMP
jgi:hypothetical protein